MEGRERAARLGWHAPFVGLALMSLVVATAFSRVSRERRINGDQQAQGGRAVGVGVDVHAVRRGQRGSRRPCANGS